MPEEKLTPQGARAQKVAWLTQLVQEQGRIPYDDAMGKIASIWSGISTKAFQDYVKVLEATGVIVYRYPYLYSRERFDKEQV